MPGAVEAVLAMEEAGLNVLFCSTSFATHPTCASEKLASFEEHLGSRWVNRVILTHDKTLVRGDVLIDDKQGITGNMAPTWTHLVLDQPYNRGLADAPRLREWNDWEAALHPPANGHRLDLAPCKPWKPYRKGLLLPYPAVTRILLERLPAA
ncbi:MULTISPECIES: hypothetical protein [Paenarthrobacter]|uniref:Uncharacterized protein n=1 Tax=Paenarthrobacter ureafaciens TaxID=37931 RepID=A0AAX3EKQ9_PAEUR|nr:MULTISPECIES: hypothetical protein [Paenarthrobacter]NKR13500.1 hypothetical protein [Arthrobacter sp. M5]NKR17181.1 hypothetical protein [Arthrobacter sp. M6]OEH61861.1 hypothetical protein A5N13_15895 [Arthrobacter sp. D4]OEH64163.1 hypothetical protein A5N17_06875 [Arthrobacter sp. D2]MDO5863488.1 hypothetical protein [Paenarthrobacter sp. SD-2]